MIKIPGYILPSSYNFWQHDLDFIVFLENYDTKLGGREAGEILEELVGEWIWCPSSTWASDNFSSCSSMGFPELWGKGSERNLQFRLSVSLHIQLWVSASLPIFCQRKLLWGWLEKALTCEYSRTPLGIILMIFFLFTPVVFYSWLFFLTLTLWLIGGPTTQLPSKYYLQMSDLSLTCF